MSNPVAVLSRIIDEHLQVENIRTILQVNLKPLNGSTVDQAQELLLQNLNQPVVMKYKGSPVSITLSYETAGPGVFYSFQGPADVVQYAVIRKLQKKLESQMSFDFILTKPIANPVY